MKASYSPPSSRRYIVMGMLLLLTWGAIGFDVYDRRKYDETIQSQALIGWGTIPDPSGKLFRGRAVVDGRKLSSDKSLYRVAVVAFRYDGTVDPDDVSGLQKSSPYDIRNEIMEIIFDFDDEFKKATLAGVYNTNYFLLLVPKDIRMEQFSTLREAKKLGVVQREVANGTP